MCHQSHESIVLAENHDGANMPMVVTLFTSPSWVPGHTQACCSPVPGRLVTLQQRHLSSPLCCPQRLSRRWRCRFQFPRSLVVARSASTDLVRDTVLACPPDHALSARAHCRFCYVQSSGLLEAVATAAIRSRLRRYDKVETSIDCNILGLLTGAVQRVDIKGTSWESRAGLTARLLEVKCCRHTVRFLPTASPFVYI